MSGASEVKAAQPCSSSDSEKFCNCICICLIHILPFSWGSLVLTPSSGLQSAEDKAQVPFFHAVSAQKHLTLCNPLNCSLPGSSVYGICAARTLVWVTTSSDRGYSWPRDHAWVSCSCMEGRFFTTEPPGKPTLSCLPVQTIWSTLPTQLVMYDVHHSVVLFLNWLWGLSEHQGPCMWNWGDNMT